VARADIRVALDYALDRAQQRLLVLGEQLRAGEITLTRWRDLTMARLKEIHLYSASAARGGWDRMSPADYGRVGARLRDQYRFLNRFADQIASGVQPLDGRFVNRVKLYAQSGRPTYHRMDFEVQRDLGMGERLNVLHPAEHCGDCLAMTALGWVALDDTRYIPIGDRECVSNDHCTEEFR
jgi:hypothetical protein